MKTRIITGVVAAALFLPFLFFAPTVLFGWVMAAVVLIAVWEMTGCVQQRARLWVSLPLALGCGSVPVLFGYGKNAVAYTVLVLTVMTVFAGMIVFSEKTDVNDGSVMLLFCLYATLGFASLVSLRAGNDVFKTYLYLWPFLAAWITDTFAYFCGRMFGRRKLCPKVSPKKTVEGALGGIVFCMIFSLLFGLIIAAISKTQIKWLSFLLIGLVLSIISQIGDLVMSLVKRKYGIKDYGNLLPGHGGILDRFDSVIATSLTLSALLPVLTLFK